MREFAVKIASKFYDSISNPSLSSACLHGRVVVVTGYDFRHPPSNAQHVFSAADEEEDEAVDQQREEHTY